MILSADWGIFMRSGEQHYASIDLSDPTSWEKIIIRIIKMPWIRRCSFDVVLDLFCICGVVLYFAADKSNGETRESSKSLIPSFFLHCLLWVKILHVAKSRIKWWNAHFYCLPQERQLTWDHCSFLFFLPNSLFRFCTSVSRLQRGQKTLNYNSVKQRRH